MADVEFDEEGSQFKYSKNNPTQPLSTRQSWLVKMGILKDESQSKNVLLLVFAINIMAIAFILYFYIL